MLDRKTVIIAGGKGQLGSELSKILKEKEVALGRLPSFYENAKILSFGSEELDITKQEEVLKLFEKEMPYCVVNCAAYTDVDGCEDNVKTAFKVNSLGARNLAVCCERVGSKLVHISTDYVFDGTQEKPRVETDQINPQSIYGRSKALGEEYVKNFCSRWFILRTSWVYGAVGKNFVKTIARVAKEKGELDVVADQFGSPTNALDLSYLIASLLVTQEYGLYHCSGNGFCSWFEFACEIVKNLKIEAKIRQCETKDIKRKAKRPQFSILENFMLKVIGKDYFRDWKVALNEFCKDWRF